MNSIELTKKLISIDSTDPGAYEFELEKYLKTLLDELKTYGVEVFESSVCDGRKNLMGVLRVSKKNFDNELVFICHMDTVVVGNDWTKKAFTAEEVDGKIYGRGSTDMKSGLAVAFKIFEYAVKEIGKDKLNRDIKVIFTVDEEADMRGVEKVISDSWVTKDSLIVDLEPTDKTIQVSHKGRFWVKLRVKGRTAHASRPELGIDANACIAHIISYIKEEVDALVDDFELGRTTVTFGLLSGGYEPYVVPDAAYVTMDFRLAPPTFKDDIISIIDEATHSAKKVFSKDVKITYEVTGDRPPVIKNENSKILNAMKETLALLYEKNKDEAYKPIVTSFPGYTDTAVIASKLKNGETLSYGPGSLALAHKPDEYVEIEDILRCEFVYRELINKYLKI